MKSQGLAVLIYLVVVIAGALTIAFFPRDYDSNTYIYVGMQWLYGGFMAGWPTGNIYWRSRRLQTRGKSATATIKSYTSYSDNDEVSFGFFAKGRIYTVWKDLQRSGTYQPGDKVKIHYLPENPKRVELDREKVGKEWLVLAYLSIIPCIIGVLHIVFQANDIIELYSIIATKLLY